MNQRSRLIVLGLVALVVSLVSGCSGAGQGQIKNAKLEVGDKAPEFELYDHTGTKVWLSDFRGKKNVVLAFYPAAWTPV